MEWGKDPFMGADRRPPQGESSLADDLSSQQLFSKVDLQSTAAADFSSSSHFEPNFLDSSVGDALRVTSEDAVEKKAEEIETGEPSLSCEISPFSTEDVEDFSGQIPPPDRWMINNRNDPSKPDLKLVPPLPEQDASVVQHPDLASTSVPAPLVPSLNRQVAPPVGVAPLQTLRDLLELQRVYSREQERKKSAAEMIRRREQQLQELQRQQLHLRREQQLRQQQEQQLRLLKRQQQQLQQQQQLGQMLQSVPQIALNSRLLDYESLLANLASLKAQDSQSQASMLQARNFDEASSSTYAKSRRAKRESRREMKELLNELAKICGISSTNTVAMLLARACSILDTQRIALENLRKKVKEREELAQLQLSPDPDPTVDHRFLFASTRVPVDIVTLSGQFLDCNDAFSNLLGFSKEELLDSGTFYALTHPDSIPSTLKFVTALLSNPVGTIYMVEKKYITKSKLEFTATIACWVSVDTNEKAQYIIGVLLPHSAPQQPPT